MSEGRTHVPGSTHARAGGAGRDSVLSLRGVGLVALAVVVGALVLPAATRKPLLPAQTTAQARSSPVASSVPAGSSAASSPSTGSSSSAPATSRPPASSSSTAPSGPAPATVHVLVANGSNVNGLAASVSKALAAKGYRLATPVSALTTVPSTVLYPLDATGQAAAGALAAVLGVPASAVLSPQSGPPPVSSTTGIDVVVVAGPDAAARFPASSSAG
jgi:cytoskeletal protein RodZ